MRDNELELIAALVEGRLEDETEARALISSAPEFRQEYEAQKIAYEALSSVGTASLTETERAALRRDVWTELRAPDAETSPARIPWYYRWVSVAAGMFVLVGLVAILNQGGGSDASQQEAAPTAADAASDTTEVASGDDTSAEAEADEESGDGGADLQSQDFAGALSASEAEFYAAEADKIRSGETAEPVVRAPEGESAAQMQTCVDDAELVGFDVLTVRATPLETEETDNTVPMPSDTNPYIIAAPDGDDPATAPLAFVDVVTCEVVYLDE